MNNKQKKIIIDHTEQIIHETKNFLILLRKLSKFVIWIIWDFSGVRFVWQKIRPQIDKATNKRPPATFLLWIVSIYLILFGITSQRYENRVDIIENRTNAILVQLSAPVDTPQFKSALSRIPTVQNMLCPVKPNVLKPNSVYNSLFNNIKHEETIDLLKETIVGFKDNLNDAYLQEVNLQDTDLSNANFQNVILHYANFQDADLYYANFQNAYLVNSNFQDAGLFNSNFQDTGLYYANFQNANLHYANFQGAYLQEINLQDAYLWETNFQDADLLDINFQNAWCKDANFKNVKHITTKQLSKAKTLYNAELDPEFMKQMKKDYPHLFEEPTMTNRGGQIGR